MSRPSSSMLILSLPRDSSCRQPSKRGTKGKMKAIKARFDGEKVILPEDLEDLKPGDVILVFGASKNNDLVWLVAQEQALAKAWDNDEDAAYDSL